MQIPCAAAGTTQNAMAKWDANSQLMPMTTTTTTTTSTTVTTPYRCFRRFTSTCTSVCRLNGMRLCRNGTLTEHTECQWHTLLLSFSVENIIISICIDHYKYSNLFFVAQLCHTYIRPTYQPSKCLRKISLKNRIDIPHTHIPSAGRQAAIEQTASGHQVNGRNKEQGTRKKESPQKNTHIQRQGREMRKKERKKKTKNTSERNKIK